MGLLGAPAIGLSLVVSCKALLPVNALDFFFEQNNILYFPFVYFLQPNVPTEFWTTVEAALTAAKVIYLILLHNIVSCDLRYRFDVLMFSISNKT
jgi:hypothetical protein